MIASTIGGLVIQGVDRKASDTVEAESVWDKGLLGLVVKRYKLRGIDFLPEGSIMDALP